MMKFQILSVGRSYGMCNVSIMALMFSKCINFFMFFCKTTFFFLPSLSQFFHESESESESNFLVCRVRGESEF